MGLAISGEALDGYSLTEFRGSRTISAGMRYGKMRGLGISLGVSHSAFALWEPQTDSLTSRITWANFGNLNSTSFDMLLSLLWLPEFPESRRRSGPKLGVGFEIGLGYLLNSFTMGPFLKQLGAETGIPVGSGVNNSFGFKAAGAGYLLMSRQTSLYLRLALGVSRPEFRIFADLENPQNVLQPVTANLDAIAIEFGFQLIPRSKNRNRR
jgi:hypothetical protein